MSNINRRNLLRAALLGTAGYGAMAGLKQFGVSAGLAEWYAAFRRQNPWCEGMDALAVLEDALRGGPSLVFVSQALANGMPKVAFLDVFMSTSFDSRNFLNVSAFGKANDPLQTLTFGSMNSSVSELIVTHPAFADAKVNKLFGDMVLTGKYKMNGAPTVIRGFESLVKDIPPSKIAMTSFVSYQGTGVHQNGQIPGAGSVAHMIQASGQLSPIGVAAFGTVQVRDGGPNGGSLIASGKSSGAFIESLGQLISKSYVPKNNDKAEGSERNKLRMFDDLNGSAEAANVRSQWLENLARIESEIQALKTGYSTLGTNTFNALGTINCDRAAAMAVAAKLAETGLCTVSSVGIGTPDFHRPDANRAPSGDSGNMYTAIVEAAVGINVWANSLIAKGMDGVAFIRTCSGRSDDWVQDSSTVSSIAVIVKGSYGGPLGSIQSAYYGPQSTATFVDQGTKEWAQGVMGLDGGTQTAGSIDGTVAEAVLSAAGQSLTVRSRDKLGKLKKG
jgi:hypothetical protein